MDVSGWLNRVKVNIPVYEVDKSFPIHVFKGHKNYGWDLMAYIRGHGWMYMTALPYLHWERNSSMNSTWSSFDNMIQCYITNFDVDLPNWVNVVLSKCGM